MAPYAIGVLFAFYLLDRKHRNLGRVRLPYWLLWLLYACIVLLLWWPVYGTKYLYDTENPHGGFTKWGNVFYIALARSGWSLGVGLLFLLSYWGYGGIVRVALFPFCIVLFCIVVVVHSLLNRHGGSWIDQSGRPLLGSHTSPISCTPWFSSPSMVAVASITCTLNFGSRASLLAMSASHMQLHSCCGSLWKSQP